MVGLSRFPTLDWWVDADEYERFTEWVEEKHGYRGRYVAFEIEGAMRAFLDEDDGAAVEELSGRLVDAAGLSRGGGREKRKQSSTRKVRARVNPEIADRFRSYVDTTNWEKDPRVGKDTYGCVLGAALSEHRDGGRSSRVREQLERVVEDAEAFLSALDDDTDDGMKPTERKRQWLASQLTEYDQFTEAEFGEHLEAMPFRGGDTEHMREKHLPAVLDRLNYVEDPRTIGKGRTAYVAADEARRVARERKAEREAEAAEEIDATADAADGRDDAQDAATVDVTERPAEDTTDDDGELSSSQRQLLEDLGGDPENPEHVRAVATDGGPSLDDVLDADDADDADGDAEAGETPASGTPSEVSEPVLTDGGTTVEAPGEADAGPDASGMHAPSLDDECKVNETDETAGPPPRVDCPCCGALVPSHVDSEARGDRAVKSCPRCRNPVDLQDAVDDAAGAAAD